MLNSIKNLTARVLGLVKPSSGFPFRIVGKIQRSIIPSKKIRNFGQLDERFYRGGQPRRQQYPDLAALGVTTIIDLRNDPKTYARICVEATGMRYVNVPMSDTEYPNSKQIDTFLKIVTDPGLGKFFVHCAGGRHRAGVIGAVYRRAVNHWSYDQAYSEMKTYGFYTRWGHRPLKRFVKDYCASTRSVRSFPTEW